jgi:hypothetical protein
MFHFLIQLNPEIGTLALAESQIISELCPFCAPFAPLRETTWVWFSLLVLKLGVRLIGPQMVAGVGWEWHNRGYPYFPSIPYCRSLHSAFLKSTNRVILSKKPYFVNKSR